MTMYIFHPTHINAIVKEAAKELHINEAVLMRSTKAVITYTTMGAIIEITHSRFCGGKGWREVMSGIQLLNKNFRNGLYGQDAQFTHRAPYVHGAPQL